MSTFTYVNRDGAEHGADRLLLPDELPPAWQNGALARIMQDGRVLFDAVAQASAVASSAPALVQASPAPVQAPASSPEPATSAAGAKPVSGGFGGGANVVDPEAKARIEAQHATLNGAGVTVNASQQVAASGTRMMQIGYETQAARAREHGDKLRATEAIDAIVACVEAEKRRDVVVSAADVARNLTSNGKLTVYEHRLSVNAVRGLSARCESPMSAYVLGLYERIVGYVSAAKALEAVKDDGTKPSAADLDRAKTLRGQAHDDRAKMADVLRYELMRAGDTRMTLRMRDAGPVDVYAALGPAYGRADAPDVLPKVRDSLPSDARATWSYDPVSTAWELRASIWTLTPVAEQAIGEAFEGWVSYRSKDNGGGRLHGGGGVTLLRCYNASVYEALGATVARVHRGKILDDVAAMTRGALSAIDALCEAWGRTRNAEVEIPSGVTIEQAIPGFWRSLLTDTRELAGVLPGRKVERVAQLTSAYFAERRDTSRVTRADFAQGWTRHIQGEDAEVRRDAEAAIGTWLVSSKRPLRCDLPTPATK